MCGRFALHATDDELTAIFGIGCTGFRIEKRYNIAPGQWIVIVRPEASGKRALHFAKWGLVPAWAESPDVGPRPFNARAEGIETKPTFRDPLRHGRCLVPASGFFEWQGTGRVKQAYFLKPQDDSLFAFAAIQSHWQAGDEGLDSCTLITVPANEAMAPLHDRMPVILPKSAWDQWLDPRTPAVKAMELLRPCPSEWLAIHPVSNRVGNVQFDDLDLITPNHPPKPLLEN